MISDFTISAGLARGVRSSYMGPAATVLGHRMSCRIRYRLPSFQVVFFWSSEQCPILKICDNEITDLESHWKQNQKATSVCLMNAKFQPKNTGPGRIFCLLSLITGFTAGLPGTGDCRCSHGCWDVLGMDAAWFREGPQMSRNCPQGHGASYAEKVLFL